MLALSALAAASFASAQQTSPFYVGGALGLGTTDGNYASQVQAAGSPLAGYSFNSARRDGDKEFAGRVYGGYRVSPNLAVELGYTNFGSHGTTYRLNKSTISAPPNALYVASGSHKLDGVTLDLVGTLPVSTALSVNGRVGVIASTLRYSETAINPILSNAPDPVQLINNRAPSAHQTRLHWGVGTAYQMNPKLALTLDYQRVQGAGNTFDWTDSGNGKLNFNLLAVGARFSF